MTVGPRFMAAGGAALLRQRSCFLFLCGLGVLGLALCGLAQAVVISEFMASNATGWMDEDGERSDWLEVTNLSAQKVSLLGYYLSDDLEDLRQWSFPDVSLPPQSSLTIFASGKDRSLAGRELHASFKLSKTGGVLALVAPDGQSLIHAYEVAYPPQLPDVSYGLDMQVQRREIISGNHVARFHLPIDDSLGEQWILPEFDDRSWQQGVMGLGYAREEDPSNEGNEPVVDPPSDEPMVLADVTFPSDVLKPTSTRSPAGEGVQGVIDNNADTKYLNFDKLNTGFTVQLSRSAVAVVGLILTSANDAPDRDPTAFVLSGSNDGERFREVARGIIPRFDNRFQSHQLDFPNDTPYRTYRLTFPSVRDPGVAVAMQIAEVEMLGWVPVSSLLESGEDPIAPVIDLGALEDISQPGDRMIPTTNNSPVGEEVWLAIDDIPQTKYLNFDGAGSGFILEPQAGETVIQGLRLTSANDVPGRDPASYRLEGSSEGQDFEIIASGEVPSFEGRLSDVEVSFVNQRAYRFYRLVFPTLRGGAGQLMQIGDVAFLGRVGLGVPDTRNLIRSDLESVMVGQHTSVFVRLPFEVEDPSQIKGLHMSARYDDGFIAYLNGVEVARYNAPQNPRFDATALLERGLESAVIEELIDLQSYAPFVRQGANVLAVHALNDALKSPSFLCWLELRDEDREVSPTQAGYLMEPSPGKINGATWKGLLPAPQTDAASGFFSEDLEVAFAPKDPETSIYFTTDGRRPDPLIGTLYQGPFTIGKTTILRAVALREGWRPSSVTTRSFLFPRDIATQSVSSEIVKPFPDRWGGQPADYGMDPRVVAPNRQDAYRGRYADSIQEDLLAIPSLSLVMDPEDWFGGQGIYANPTARSSAWDAWERAVSVEWLDPDRAEGFQIDAGIKIQGGAFRNFGLTLKKSFRLMFKDPYGPTKLEFPVFGESATDRFDNLVLRANGNDAWPYAGGSALYVRDAFAMETARAMGMMAPHTRFVHLYLNGAYWGLYNLVERPDAAFSSTYHGGDKDDWDALNQDSVPDGTREAWNRLLSLLNQGMADDASFFRIQGRDALGHRDPEMENLLDVENLIDYCLLNFFIGNRDWPGRNHWYGRDRTGSQGFQFYPWDSETAMGLGSDLQTNITGASGSVAAPYAALRANALFRQWFGDRAHQHFSPGGALYVHPDLSQWLPATPENNPAAARFARLASQVESAMVGESARWGDQKGSGPFTRDEHWLKERDRLLAGYFPGRSAVVLEQLREAGLYPQIDAPTLGHPGGFVERGFELSMQVPEGSLYYTLDGSDPRSKLEGVELARTCLVDSQTPRWVLIPSTQNGGSALGERWKESLSLPLDGWQSGRGGVGYDTAETYQALIGMDVSQAMPGQNRSAYIRIPFETKAASLKQANFLQLRMRYDDGFAAFLNGIPLASANAPGNLIWNSFASGAHDDAQAILFETFDVSGSLEHLREGANLLAIHGLNVSSTSSDFLIDAELVVGQREVIGEEPTAHLYQSPIVLSDATTIKARTLVGAQWSALTTATFVMGEPQLQVSELHYHPAAPGADEIAAGFDDADDFEFIELFNPGGVSFPLIGVHFVDGVRFDFTEKATEFLAPGQTLLVVSHQGAFEMRYGEGLPVAGEYEGNFSNSGERVILEDAQGKVVLDFAYEDQLPELQAADGGGFSLVALQGGGDPRQPTTWTLSDAEGGSPGKRPSGDASGLLRPTLSIDQDKVLIECQVPLNGDYGLFASQDLGGMQWDMVLSRRQVASLDSLQFEIELGGTFPMRFFQIRKVSMLP